MDNWSKTSANTTTKQCHECGIEGSHFVCSQAPITKTYNDLIKENEENCRLLGKGVSREAALMGKLEIALRALGNIRNCLGPNKIEVCKSNKCAGCQEEMLAALDYAKEALEQIK
jgi:hypothetical protein